MPKYKSSVNMSKKALSQRLKSYSHPTTITPPIIRNTAISFHLNENIGSPINQSASDLELQDEITNELNSDDNESVLSDFDELDENSEDYASFLKTWKFKYNVTNSALNGLLVFLRNNGHPELPKDSRTLLQTPKSRDLIDITPGKYVHIGLEASLKTILTKFYGSLFI